MKTQRIIFAVACALLQSAAPVFSSEVKEPVDAFESSIREGEQAGAVLESDAQPQEPVAIGIRGSLKESIASPSGSKKLTVRVVKGEIYFVPILFCRFDEERQFCLMLYLVSFPSQTRPATNLEGEDTIGTSDVYVAVKVYKSNWGKDETIGEDKTEIVESLNPLWNEDFEFLIPSTDDMRLKLTVWDEDTGRPDDKMGETTINLDDYNLSSKPTTVEKVVDSHWTSSDEKITVTLKLQ